MDHFLPFYPLENLKNQNFDKIKKAPADIIILHKHTRNHDQMLYCFWHVTNVIAIFHFGLFLAFYPPNQSGTLYQSGNNYPDDDIVTWSGNFYFSFKGDSYHFRKPNLFIFISAREFSFLHFAFSLLKILQNFKLFYQGNIKVKARYSVFSFLIEPPPHLFEKKFPQIPILAFEFQILWLAGRQNYLVKQQFPD